MSNTSIYRNALAAGTLLLEYRVESVLGVGGFGMTYLARDTNLDKAVAIKEYFPSAIAMRALDGSVVSSDSENTHDYQWGLERFLQESRTLARFSHPHIVRVNRYFEANTTGYMVMDYENGESLHQHLKRSPQPAEARIKQLLNPLLDGLQAVHNTGFLHRDIKPANIFIRERGDPVLIDFGSARQAMSDSTKTLTSVLTPGYAPLEQYSGDSDQGPWTDIYAMGGVLYRVFTGENPPDAVSRLKFDPVPAKLNNLTGRVSMPVLRAVEWAMAMDEKSRPQNIDAWRAALEGKTPPTLAATRPLSANELTTRPLGNIGNVGNLRTAGNAGAVATQIATGAEPATALATGIARPGAATATTPPRPAASRTPSYVADEPDGSTIWRWLGIGAVVLVLFGFGHSWYKRSQAREQAAKVTAEETARNAKEAREARAREAEERLRQAQLERAQAASPAANTNRTPEQIALAERELALREKELRAAEREAALRKQEEERARDKDRLVSTVPPPVAKSTPPASEPAKQATPATPDTATAPADPFAQKIAADFRANDANGDGYLTMDEIRGRMPGLEKDFARVDLNGDGRISLEELLARRPFGPPLSDSESGGGKPASGTLGSPAVSAPSTSPGGAPSSLPGGSPSKGGGRAIR